MPPSIYTLDINTQYDSEIQQQKSSINRFFNVKLKKKITNSNLEKIQTRRQLSIILVNLGKRSTKRK